MQASDDSSVPRWRRWLRGRSKTVLALAAASGLIIFWIFGGWLAIPAEWGHNGSLLAQPGLLLDMDGIFTAAVGLAVVCLLWRGLLGRGADPLLTLFAAAAGLAALSWRGGSMTDVLQEHSASIFLRLCFEEILLAALLAGCWWCIVRFDTGKAPVDEFTGGRDPLTALLLTAGIMGLCVWFLAPVDAKKQVVMAVGVGGFAGAAITYACLEIDAGLYYAAAPLLLGAFAYLFTLFNPGQYAIGVTGEPLAHPLPLDYASVGVIGSLLGYWTAQAWRLEAM